MLKRTAMAILAISVLAASAMAADVKSGLTVGAKVGAFDVVDVSGPNKGKQLCYRCQYGGAPVVAAFIKGDAAEGPAIASAIQKLTQENDSKGLRTFVVFMGGPELKGNIEKIAAEKKITIPLTFLPAGSKASDIAEYKINPQASSTVLLWNKGAVQANFVNITRETWADVTKATASMLQ
jgi:hypothetical protein